MTCCYCTWFVAFFRSVVNPYEKSLILLGSLGVVRDFSSVVAFFIPLKVIMVLSSPEILESYISNNGKINIEEFFYYSGIAFFGLMVVSMACQIVLSLLMHKRSYIAWLDRNNEFPSRTKYRNLYYIMLDTVTHVLIIFLGLIGILFLDAYLFPPVFITLVVFLIVSTLLSKYKKNDLLSSPLKNPKFVFRIVRDAGFSLTFLFIVFEYYSNINMNFLFSLMSVLLSRIIFINMQQLFIKHRGLFDEYYCQISVKK